MIISNEYDFVVFPKSIKYYDDYNKENSPDNIELHEKFNDRTGVGEGKIIYRNKFDSDISEVEKEAVFKRILFLLKQGHIRMEIAP
jgi:hypothetical protein